MYQGIFAGTLEGSASYPTVPADAQCLEEGQSSFIQTNKGWYAERVAFRSAQKQKREDVHTEAERLAAMVSIIKCEKCGVYLGLGQEEQYVFLYPVHRRRSIKMDTKVCSVGHEILRICLKCALDLAKEEGRIERGDLEKERPEWPNQIGHLCVFTPRHWPKLAHLHQRKIKQALDWLRMMRECLIFMAPFFLPLLTRFLEEQATQETQRLLPVPAATLLLSPQTLPEPAESLPPALSPAEEPRSAMSSLAEQVIMEQERLFSR